MTTTQRKLLVKGAIFGILIFLISVISRYGPQPFNLTGPQWQELGDVTEFYSSKKRLKRFLMSFGPYSAGVFTLLQALQVVVAPIPGELTGVVGGYLYGNAFGFLLSTLGLTLGSWVAFELASALGRPFVERLVKKEIIERFNFVTTSAGVTTCFLLFLLPGFPKRLSVLCPWLESDETQHLLDHIDPWSSAWHLCPYPPRSEHKESRVFHRGDRCCYLCRSDLFWICLSR